MFSRSNNERTAAMMNRPMSRRALLKGSLAMGASAYHGAAASIKNPDVLSAALSIHAN